MRGRIRRTDGPVTARRQRGAEGRRFRARRTAADPKGCTIADHPEQNVMLRVVPLLIAYGAWLTFVLTWHSVNRTARTIATPPPSRERLYLLVISFGLVLFVLGPLPYPKGRLWVNP